MDFKKISHFVKLAFFSIGIISLAFADTPTTIYTPKGSIVPDTYIMDEMSPSEIAYGNWWVGYYYPNATRLTDATRTYNCHGYAWHISEGGNNVWIGKYTATAEDIYWQDGSYLEAKNELCGDKVSYVNDNHSAITTSQYRIYISKWGSLPLMRHDASYCPYNASSRNYYEIYTSVSPPPAPTGLVLQNEGEYDEAPELYWNSSTCATSYKVYRRFDGGSWVYVATTSYTNYTDYDATVNYWSDYWLEYYVTAVNGGGESGSSNIVGDWGYLEKRVIPDERSNIPVAYSLKPNYPNPFNPATAIRYDLPEASRVSLVIYDIAGREVRSWNLQEQAGYRHVMWDAKNQSGRMVPAGIYIYRLVAISSESDKRFTATRKMVLLK